MEIGTIVGKKDVELAGKTESDRVAETMEKTIIRETEGTDEKNADEKSMSRQGDQYISSEQELHDASGLYRVARGSDGGVEIKFDDKNLEKKRNALKQELTKLQASRVPEDKERETELRKKLATIEKKIRAQKQK